MRETAVSVATLRAAMRRNASRKFAGASPMFEPRPKPTVVAAISCTSLFPELERLEHREGGFMLQRVMHAKELCAQAGGDDVGGERPDEAPVDPLAGKIAKDRLAGDADEHRETEASQLWYGSERSVILRARLAKTDARIEKDEALCDAGAACRLERALEKAQHLVDDVDSLFRHFAIVHDHDERPGVSNDSRHRRVALQSPDVVDHQDAGGQRAA